MNFLPQISLLGFIEKVVYFQAKMMAEMIKQKIVGFHQDKIGDLVADLACGHTRHMRHQPPWRNRPWVETQAGRKAHLGEEIDCKKCTEIDLQGKNEMLKPQIPEEKQRIAEAVKGACLKAALEAYQNAQISGLCREGAWDLAVDAMRSLNIEEVLNTLPD